MARFASPSWAWLLVSLVVLSPCFLVPVLAVDRFELVWNELLESRKALRNVDYDRKDKKPAQPPAAEVPSRTINAPEDGWLDKDGKVHRRHTADVRILQRDLDERGKKLHVEHEYGAEVAMEFDAVDPLGEKGSADNKELKKAIEKVKAKKPSSSSSRVKPSSSSRKPESFRSKRTLGLAVKNAKEPFAWPDIAKLVRLRCRDDSGICSWTVAVAAAISFAGFCRYNDIRVLQWEDVSFLSTYLEFRFVKRKNDQRRLCGKVRVAKMPGAVVCVYGLLRRYHAVMIRWATPTLPVFPGFSGTVLRHKGELGMVPSSSPIEYPTFRRYLARWWSPLLTPAITEAAFLTRFGTQSSRSGGASAAANADIPFATWGHHGGWKSTSAQLRYMGLGEEHVLSVSRAILTLAEEDELDDSDGDGSSPADTNSDSSQDAT
eukprot:jgi/Tetstr1/425844/TSEL_016221.t1